MSKKVLGSTAKEIDAKWCKPTYVIGEGYPYGLIWLDEHTKNDSTIMLIREGHNHYDLWTRNSVNNKYTPWQKVTSFHDYELKDFAVAILERAIEEEISVMEKVKANA